MQKHCNLQERERERERVLLRGVGWLNVKEGYDYTSGRDELRKKNSGLDCGLAHVLTFLAWGGNVDMNKVVGKTSY